MKQKRACFGGLAALPADASENGRKLSVGSEKDVVRVWSVQRARSTKNS